jgi:non-heme chloroperoxidase
MPSFTTPDGVRLDYLESGDPAGRAVVLVAGFKAPATSWRWQSKALAKAGYRVIALDRRGHGTSELGELEHNTMAQHGADLLQLLALLDLEDAVLIGGSMGANVIWTAVEQGGTPRIGAILIVDQTPKMLNSPDWPHGFYDYDESNRDTLFARAIPDPRRFPIAKKGPVRIFRLLRALDLGRASVALTGPELALLHDHAVADWRDGVAMADVPVLFVAGDESEFWPSSHAAASAGIAPQGRWLVIPNDGHAANIEQPKVFNKVMLEFLGSL